MSCRIDLPSVHVPSTSSRELKSICGSRETLVSTRTKLINNVRGWLRTQLWQIRTGATVSFHERLRVHAAHLAVTLPDHIERQLRLLEALSTEIRAANAQLRQLAKNDPTCRALMSVPGARPITAVRLRAAIDDVTRFSTTRRTTLTILDRIRVARRLARKPRDDAAAMTRPTPGRGSVLCSTRTEQSSSGDCSRRMMAGRLVVSLSAVAAYGCAREPPARLPTPPAPDAARPTPGHPIALPIRYIEDRFVLAPRTRAGQTVALLADTGGGQYITDQAARRLGLATATVRSDGRERDAAIVPSLEDLVPALGQRTGTLPIVPAARTQGLAADGNDGMLGQAWFADRLWTFDYPGHRLLWRAPGDVPPHDPAHEARLGFAVTSSGRRGANFPRIEVSIDGAPVELLFDTGATVHLSDAALAALGGGAATRATSFISQSTFERWHARHPAWRVIDGADRMAGGEPMIEVPAVTVAGFTVGPVWFTRRADRNFHDFVSQFTDRTVDGALGGSALHYFRITVDYPRAVAVFEQPPA